jgi:hypothetical protein
MGHRIKEFVTKSDYSIHGIAYTRSMRYFAITVRGEPWRSWVSVSATDVWTLTTAVLLTTRFRPGFYGPGLFL